MYDVIQSKSDCDYRYRITRIDRGVLLSCQKKQRPRRSLGWLYRTEEAAEKGMEAMILLNAMWDASARGYSVEELTKRFVMAAYNHRDAIKRFDDPPAEIGEVRLALLNS